MSLFDFLQFFIDQTSRLQNMLETILLERWRVFKLGVSIVLFSPTSMVLLLRHIL